MFHKTKIILHLRTEEMLDKTVKLILLIKLKFSKCSVMYLTQFQISYVCWQNVKMQFIKLFVFYVFIDIIRNIICSRKMIKGCFI